MGLDVHAADGAHPPILTFVGLKYICNYARADQPRLRRSFPISNAGTYNPIHIVRNMKPWDFRLNYQTIANKSVCRIGLITRVKLQAS